MPATATIDLIPYTNNITDSTSSAKSYADDSDKFEDILNNASKAYSTEQESSKEVSTNHSDEKTQKVEEKTAENSDEKTENTTKTNEDKNQENTNSIEKKVEKKETTKISEENSQKDNNTNNVKEKADTDTKNKNDNGISKNDKTKDEKQADEIKIEPKLDTKPNTLEKLTQQEGQTPQQDLKTPDNIPNANNTAIPAENIIGISQTAVNAEVTTVKNEQNMDKATPVQIGQAQNVQTSISQSQIGQTQTGQIQADKTQILQDDFNVNLNNLTNLDEITGNTSNNTKVQTQTQQTLSNLTVNQQDASSQTQPSQTSIEAAPIQKTDVQTPVVDAKTVEVIVSDINVNPKSIDANTKKDNQDNLNKTALTQEIINNTNTKVVNVETANSSSSNSNNLLDRQNAHEQAIKIALESNSTVQDIQDNTQNTNQTNAIDTTTQAAFDKILNTAQSATQTDVTQTTAQTQTTQTPKEISQSDILSQINNQLNTKKFQEEGTTKINIVLKPENLGKINLELVNSKDGLTAKLTTDNAQVKELLNKSLDSLKDSLSNHGVNVNSITVKVEETQKQSNNNMFSFDNREPNSSNQEFSNNAQKQNQNEFSFDGKNNKTIDTGADLNIEPETEAKTNSGIENVVSVNSGLGKVDYKI